jgi:hypothetical protein
MDCSVASSLFVTASPNAFIAASGVLKSFSACAAGKPPKHSTHPTTKLRKMPTSRSERNIEVDVMLVSP